MNKDNLYNSVLSFKDLVKETSYVSSVNYGAKKEVYREIGLQELNIDPQTIINWYVRDPQVYGGINRLVDFVSSSGYDIKGESPENTEAFFEGMGLPYFLRLLTCNTLLFGNGFIELRDDAPTVVDSSNIKPVFNEVGRVVGFVQRNIGGTDIPLPLDSLIHVKFDSLGFGIYGITPILPLQKFLTNKYKLEQHSAGYFDRNGVPRLHYKIKSKNPARIKLISEQVKSLRNYEDIVSPDDLEITPIAQNIDDMIYGNWLDYTNSSIRMGLGVPDIIAGFSRDSNKANSRMQYQAFKVRIKSMQTVLADAINNHIIPHYLGKDTKSYLVFRDFDKEDSNITAENRKIIAHTLSYYVKNGILTPEEAKERAIKDLDSMLKDVIE